MSCLIVDSSEWICENEAFLRDVLRHCAVLFHRVRVPPKLRSCRSSFKVDQIFSAKFLDICRWNWSRRKLWRTSWTWFLDVFFLGGQRNVDWENYEMWNWSIPTCISDDVIWNNQRFPIFHPTTNVVQGPTFEKSGPVVVKGATHLSWEDEDKFDYYEVVFEPDDAPPLGLRTEKGHFSCGKIDRNQMVRYHTNWWSSKTDGGWLVINELSLMSDLILAGVFLKSTSCIFWYLWNQGTKQVTNSVPPYFPIRFPHL